MSYPPQQYTAEAPAVSATLRSGDAPVDLTIGARSKVSYLATGETTNGMFGLYRWDLQAVPPPDSLPGGHFHRTMAESFYILSGTVALGDGEKWVDASPGDYLYVPPGGIHSFANTSGEPASMLILFAPGGPREAYFEELADITAKGRELTHDEWVELWARHDQYEATITTG
ncbi:mannose-6-phosphate isomerase-like protein (cupin superfamily) [Hamadaea flava]|uniref:Cupin domain-containing protein n=1 Tax=Hamadaea flava TaxID=1742688 RepID=A0ABV8LQ47_9ACTN|nr:cupin domain-containing protein [Hamadaea flava]MCP2322286.1 mannose-6-phosphate isomerase-like protein (cupin superfamily) [Hamadaea flava]